MFPVIQRYPWALIFREVLAADTNTNLLRTRVTIPILNLYATFRIVITTFTAGSVVGKLRFGFTDADTATTAANVLGIDFRLLNAAAQSDWQGMQGNAGAAVPQTFGHGPLILPPRVALFITTVAATLTYEVYSTCLGME